AVGAFLMTGAFAVCIGLAFGTFFQPGHGVDLSALAAVVGSAASKAPEVPKDVSVIQILVNTIPTNVIKAMAEDQILQVVVFSIFVGVMLNKLGAKVQNLIDLCKSIALVVFRLIETVIRFSPYGVFALTSWMVGTQGMPILIALFKLVCVVIGALLTQYLL